MDTEDKLSFLDGDKGASAPETAATPAPAPVTPLSTEQPRDEHGKFAPKATDAPALAAAAPQPEPVAAAPAPQPAAAAPEQKQEAIPLATALQWRDDAKAAKRELEQLKAQRTQQPQPVPSASEDPEAFEAHINRLIEGARSDATFKASEIMAREKHGDEVVAAAKQWALEKCEEEGARLGFSPFAAEYMRQEHPLDWAVKQQKRSAVLSQIGDDPEAYIAAEIARRTAAPPPPSPQAATPAPAPPPVAPVTPAPAAPRSIASQPAAGASQHVTPSGPGRAFEATFQP